MSDDTSLLLLWAGQSFVALLLLAYGVATLRNSSVVSLTVLAGA
jgi:hypothetical protein